MFKVVAVYDTIPNLATRVYRYRHPVAVERRAAKGSTFTETHPIHAKSLVGRS